MANSLRPDGQYLSEEEYNKVLRSFTQFIDVLYEINGDEIQVMTNRDVDQNVESILGYDLGELADRLRLVRSLILGSHLDYKYYFDSEN